MRKAISILLIIMVLLSSVAPVFAAGTAFYEGNKVFEFKPGSEKSETDLFGDDAFKGVMPGDVLEGETVTVKNSSKKTVKMYMQPLGKLDETVSGFLSQMTLTVTNLANGEVIFEDTADKGLDSEVLLGKLAKGGSVTLEVALSVSPDMGDEYQGADGFLGWKFLVEEITDPVPVDEPDEPYIPPVQPVEPPVEPVEPVEPPVEPVEPPVQPIEPPVEPGPLPQTGQLWWPVLLLVCLGLAFFILGIVRRRKNEE